MTRDACDRCRVALVPGEYGGGWHIDKAAVTVEQIAKLFKRFIYDQHYAPAFANYAQKPTLGFIIAGYSPGEGMAEEWDINIESPSGRCNGPVRGRPIDECGISARGQPEAISRLYLGYSSGLPHTLSQAGFDGPTIHKVIQACAPLQAQVIYDPMPIKDAIDLAAFLVEVTAQYERFTPGPPTVGGPTEVAAITKHEGFKWIQRKYYYEQRFQPPREGSQ